MLLFLFIIIENNYFLTKNFKKTKSLLEKFLKLMWKRFLHFHIGTKKKNNSKLNVIILTFFFKKKKVDFQR